MLRCCKIDFLPLDCSRDYKLQIVYNTWHFLKLACTIAAENAAQNNSGVWTGRNKAKGSPAQIVCQKGGGPKYLLWVVTTGLPTVVWTYCGVNTLMSNADTKLHFFLADAGLCCLMALSVKSWLLHTHTLIPLKAASSQKI